MEKCRKISTKLINKVGYLGALATFTTNQLMAKAVAFADGPAAGGGGVDNGKAMNVAQKIIDVLAQTVPSVIGAFFLFTGVFKAILAYRQENPEAVATAAKDIAVGAILIVFGLVIWPAISPVIFG